MKYHVTTILGTTHIIEVDLSPESTWNEFIQHSAVQALDIEIVDITPENMLNAQMIEIVDEQSQYLELSEDTELLDTELVDDSNDTEEE